MMLCLHSSNDLDAASLHFTSVSLLSIMQVCIKRSLYSCSVSNVITVKIHHSYKSTKIFYRFWLGEFWDGFELVRRGLVPLAETS